MTKFTSLYSGSDKNSLLLQHKSTKILIDCGGSFKQIKERLSYLNTDIYDLDAVLITHDHIDHIAAIKMFIKNTDIKIYSSMGTHKSIYHSDIDMPYDRRVIIKSDNFFGVKDILIEPFQIPHDTQEPFGYNFICGTKTATVLTDVGYVSDDLQNKIKGRDFVFLESNHDQDLLMRTNRPIHTIKRILGENGHLCNEDSAKCSLKLICKGLNRLMLGHLSGDANNPQLAYDITSQTLSNSGVAIGKDVDLSVAERGIISKTIYF